MLRSFLKKTTHGLVQARHLIDGKARWQREANRSSKFNMFANLFGNTLLGAMDAGLDLTNAYVTVGKNGSVGFTTWESFTKGDESDLDAKLKLASKITEQYVKDYHDESMSDIMFQRKHNDYVATLSYVLLNQIYGEGYISKEYLPVV